MRLKPVGQAFDDDAKKLAITAAPDQIIQHTSRPGFRRETVRE
jgi:hypothetical protein